MLHKRTMILWGQSINTPLSNNVQYSYSSIHFITFLTVGIIFHTTTCSVYPIEYVTSNRGFIKPKALLPKISKRNHSLIIVALTLNTTVIYIINHFHLRIFHQGYSITLNHKNRCAYPSNSLHFHNCAVHRAGINLLQQLKSFPCLQWLHFLCS